MPDANKYSAVNPLLLVVDDQIENLQLLGGILQESNYRVAVAGNGIEAIEFTNKMKPDLILLDIMMPKMDGFEVCAKLKSSESTKDIPVIFLSAKTDTVDLVKGFQLGGVDYVCKPFNSDELLSRINTHISLKISKELILKQNIELSQLNKEKDRYLKIIAHDLRNPNSVIFGFSNIILNQFQQLSTSELQDFVELIKKASENMEQIIRKLLDSKNIQNNIEHK